MGINLGIVAALCWVGLAQPHTASLPRTGGEVVVPGLVGTVEVTRDATGIPVIRGDSLDDAIRAQGFVHAQDRFFQMDATRRFAAGRLAEVIGPPGVALDEHYRAYRFEHVAEAIVNQLPAEQRRWLEIYTEGVNAGLADLAAPPPEYLLLLAQPAPWRARDSILVMLAMFDVLNFNTSIERPLGVMKSVLPPALFDFLTPLDTRFEAPLLPGHERAPPAPLPGPDIVDLRRRSTAALPPDLVRTPPVAVGSNSWAVAGSRTTHGGAILANDPHLQITVPGIWYRAELRWPDHHVIGLSLPGNPGIVIGSNRHVAWGFTNTMGDFQDLVVIETVPGDPARYRTPEGSARFEEIEERIRVRRGTDRTITLQKTRWGMVVDRDHEGRRLALRWTALDPDKVNLALLGLMTAGKLEEAVSIARAWYGPSQNAVLADDRGRIAWVVTGYLPRRVGFDGSVPVSWADGEKRWEGPLDEALRPVLVDPEDGVVFTANNRTVDPQWARVLGNGWDLGARAGRIRDLLRRPGKRSEADLRAMQLDTRVELFEFYRTLILEQVDAGEDDALRREARDIVRAWNGTAAVDQPALVILDAYRGALHRAVVAPLVAPCREVDPGFAYFWLRSEEMVRRILETRPAHLLPPGTGSWPDLLGATLDRVLDGLIAATPAEGLRRPWGEANRARIEHPLARAIPAFGRMLNMPARAQPGHRFALRVATSRYGASARLVVSPGREEEGLLHIPGGQSGHPMSPHYRDSHPAWADGLSTPLLAGEPRAHLRLVPEGR